MRLPKNLGVILLAVYLILVGLTTLFDFSFSGLGVVLGLLALIAGVLLLWGPSKLPSGWGLILLAVWLILTGLIALFGLSFSGLGLIMGILALAAGILLLLDR